MYIYTHIYAYIYIYIHTYVYVCRYYTPDVHLSVFADEAEIILLTTGYVICGYVMLYIYYVLKCAPVYIYISIYTYISIQA